MYRGREAWVRGVNTLRGRLRRPRMRLSPVTMDQNTPPQADYGIRHQREIMFRYRRGEFMVTPYPRGILTNQICPGLAELASNSHRGAPYTNKQNVFVSSEIYLADIDSACDPAHPSLQCDVTFEDSFNNTVFPLGTHELAYARAVYLDMGPLSDPIFSADTGMEVERLCRAFSPETNAWKVHVEGLIWQTFEWRMKHDPPLSRRIYNSGDASFKLATPCGHWGTGPDGKGINTYGQLPSEFRDVQLELGIFGGLSRAADREGETNTDHDSDDSTLLNDMAEVSTTIGLHNSNEKISTEPRASISKPRGASPVNPQLDKVDSPKDDDISMGSQSDDDTITDMGRTTLGERH